MPTPHPFEVHTEPGLVRAAGELDMDTAGSLREALAAQPDGPLELDMTAVTFIDSTGLALLIETAKARGELTIRPSAAVTRLTELCGLQDLLPLRA